MRLHEIKLARELLHLSQAELGQVLDVHAQTVSKWERGQLAPSPIRLAILDGVLGNNSAMDDPRTLGRVIRKLLASGNLLKAHLLLVLHAHDWQLSLG